MFLFVAFVFVVCLLVKRNVNISLKLSDNVSHNISHSWKAGVLGDFFFACNFDFVIVVMMVLSNEEEEEEEVKDMREEKIYT